MDDRPRNSEPFLVQWREGKLVPVDAPPPAAPAVVASMPPSADCGHDNAQSRSCPLDGTACDCCARCAGECQMEVE